MDLIFVAFLVLPSVINAAVCPSSLYFFASDNVDNRVTFARTNATSFEDCIRKCYASDFCFSVVFNPAPLDSNLASECRLSYVSAFICTSKTLVNSHPNPTRPFIAECLKCPALGENTPQTISEFAEFTVNGANVSATVTTARSSASFNNISAKITESDIGPNSNVTTLSTSSTSQSASVTTALNENLSASDLRNTGNIFQTSTAAGALRACSNLTFEIVEIDKDEVPTSKQLASEFQNIISSSSVSDCAKKCYERQCAHAIYVQPLDSDIGQCYVNFNGTEVCSASKRITNYTLGEATHIRVRCLQCKPSQVVIQPSIGNNPVSQNVAAESPRICSGTLTFNVLDPAPSRALAFSNHSQAESADECAKLCYERRCTIAGFAPPVDINSKGSCLFSYGLDQCTTENSLSHYAAKGLVQIECLKCAETTQSSLNLSIATSSALPTSTTTRVSSLSANVSETTQAISTSTSSSQLPLINSSIPLAETTQSSTVPQSTTKQSTTNSSSPSSAIPSISSSNLPESSSSSSTSLSTETSIAHSSTVASNGPTSSSLASISSTVQSSSTVQLSSTEQSSSTSASLLPEISASLSIITNSNSTSNVTETSSVVPPLSSSTLHELSTSHSSAFASNSTANLSETTREKVEGFPSPKPVDGFNDQTCQQLSFEPRKPDFDINLNFTQQVSSQFIEECAKLCFLSNCTTATFLPSQNSLTSKGSCYFSFDPVECSTTVARKVNFFDFAEPIPIVLHCVRCEDELKKLESNFLPVIQNPPSVVPKGPIAQLNSSELTSNATSQHPNAVEETTRTAAEISSSLAFHSSTSSLSSQSSHSTSSLPTQSSQSSSSLSTSSQSSIPLTSSFHSTSLESSQSTSSSSTFISASSHSEITTHSSSSTVSPISLGTTKIASTNAPKFCIGEITFQSRIPSPDRIYSHSINLNFSSPGECVRVCFEKSCTMVSYIKSAIPEESDICLLGFDSEVCDTNAPRSSNHTGRFPAEFHCIRCDDNQPKSSLPKENSLAAAGNPIGFELPLETSQAPIAPVKEVEKNFIRLRPCIAEITFEISPQLEVDEKSYLTNSSVKDAEECAKECFERNCTLARYLVENLLGSPINCLFSFESDKCTGGKRVSNYSDILPVTLHCIQCVAEQVDDKSKAAFIKSNQVSKIEVINQTEAKEFSVTSTVASSTVPATSKEVTLASTTSLHAIPINSSSSSIETSSTSPLLIISVSTVQPRETSIGRKVQAISESSTTIVLSHSSVAINATISSVESSHVTVPNVNESYSSTHETTASSTSQPSTTLANIDETDLGEINSTDGFFVVGNCTVLFEAHEPNPNIPFNWINRTAGFSLPECAAQCYLDGCNAVSYKPFEGDEKDICLFSFGPEQCNGDDKISYIPEKYPVLIQCVRCVNGFHLLTPAPRRNNTTTRPSTTIGNKVAIGNSSIQSEITTSKIESSTIKALLSQSTIEVGKETSVAPIQSSFHQPTPVKTVPTFSSPLLQLSTLAAQGPAIFSTVQQPAVVSAANSSLPIPDVKKPLAALPVIKDLQNQNAVPSRTASAPQPARAQTIPIPTGGSEQSTVEENVASEDEFVSRMTPAVIRTCWGHLRFYVEPMETFELQSTDYTFYTSTTTAEECASFCYRRACSSAQYIPINEEKQFGGKCRLRFTDVQCPSDIQGFVSNVATLLTSPIILRCITCVKPTTSESTFANQTSFVTPPQFLFPIKTPPSTERTCYNRVSFQIQPPISSIAVKFTVDMFVPSATDCAKACYSKHCEVAGYIPALNKEGSGVCLLSETKATCLANYPKQVEEIRTNPFILDCIECTPCNFTIRNINRSFLRNFEDRLKTASLTECAQMCHRRNCTSAAYFAQGSNDANCFLSNSLQENCNATDDRRQLNLISHIPVLLECVRCDADVN